MMLSEQIENTTKHARTSTSGESVRIERLESLTCQSGMLHNHSRRHTEEELKLIRVCDVAILSLVLQGFRLRKGDLSYCGKLVPLHASRRGTLINLAVIYLVLIAMIGLTLFLSARMKSPYLVLIVVVPVLFIPMFLSPNGTSGIYNLFVFLTPYQSLIPNFGSYLSYQFGPLVLDAFTMRAVMYVILALILLPLARIGFKKHQVS